jgi:hypothetical protein
MLAFSRHFSVTTLNGINDYKYVYTLLGQLLMVHLEIMYN